ncbi:MAG: dihydrolipoamide acetyltransferase family protein [Candidatus Geothermarchaeales archaeon]
MPLEFKLPDVGEGVAEGEVIKWHVREGDEIKEDAPLVEVMTDKATVEIPSPAGGTVLKLMAPEGGIVKVGAVLAVIGEEGEKVEPVTKEAKKTAEAVVEKRIAKKRVHVAAAPATRRLARQLGVDLSLVTPTGPRGHITKGDVQKFAERMVPEQPSELVEERIPLRGIRRRISEKMILSKHTAAHVTHVDAVDVTELVALREKAKAVAQERGVRLTYLPFIIKALIPALREYPYLNSSLDDEKGEIILKKYYNIGIATATDKGLMVPVVKDADKKGEMELAEEIERLTRKARGGEIQLEDLRGGTFTITNIGALGGIFSTPIINLPEVAILGVHKIRRQPVVVDGGITIRDMTYLALTFDHRVVDGDTAASFTNTVIQDLENPGLFLIEMP